MSLTFTFGWTLLHFLWQGTAIALGVWIVLALSRRARPERRYLAAWAGLALMAVSPVATFAVLRHTEPAPSVLVGPLSGRIEANPVETLVEAAPTALRRMEPGALLTFRGRLDQVAPYLLPVWVLGVILLGLRHAGGLTWLARARRRSRPLEDGVWAERVEILRRAFGVTREITLRVLDELEGPVVGGLLKPVILVPTSVLTGMPAAQVELLLAHEIAHVARHDALANLVQRCVETLLFFHPAVWWLGRRVRQERERCCDALAADLLGDPCGMAEALTSLALMNHAVPLPAFALGAEGGSLKERVQALLDFHAPVNRWRLYTAVCVLLVCAGSGWALWKLRARRLARLQPAMEAHTGLGSIQVKRRQGQDTSINLRMEQATPEAALAAFARAEETLKRWNGGEAHESIRAVPVQTGAQTYSLQWGGLARPDFLEYMHRLKARPALDCPPDAIVTRRDNLGLPWDQPEDPPLDVWVPKHADRFSPDAARLLREALLELRALAPTPGLPQEVRRKLPESVLAGLKSPEAGSPVLRGWDSAKDEQLIQRCQEEPFEPVVGFRYAFNTLKVDLKAPGAADLQAIRQVETVLEKHRTTGPGPELARKEKDWKRFSRMPKIRGQIEKHRLSPQEQEALNRWRAEGERLNTRLEALDGGLTRKGFESAAAILRKRLADLGVKPPAPPKGHEARLRLNVSVPSPNRPDRVPALEVHGTRMDPALLKSAPAKEADLLRAVLAQVEARISRFQAAAEKG